MARLFGTDGIRGVANSELDCELSFKVGAAGAQVLASEVHAPKILVGADTRLSGSMLKAALSAGICSVGGDVLDVGVLPTPAMAHLVRVYEADAAVMISASHNTMEYNGIKWFNGQGYKLSDSLEDEIEGIISDCGRIRRAESMRVGQILSAARAQEEYRSFLKSAAEGSFSGMKLVLDCANGAASGIAYQVFSELGATVISRADDPDGYNINDLCGSTHPEYLQDMVQVSGADAGFAFDGDADRVIAADELGNVVDGDRIMGINALSLKSAGKLKNNTLVVTVMSNLGLKNKMNESGIMVAETAVGDRYVLERMLQDGHCLGGEQSGHVIFSEHNTTGDGMLTAIQTLNVMKKTGRRLSSLAREIPIYPQVLVNVAVPQASKEAAMEDAELKQCAHAAEAELNGSGRVLIRKSGTEPLIRIMLEGVNEAQIRDMAVAMAKVVERNHGGKIKN